MPSNTDSNMPHAVIGARASLPDVTTVRHARLMPERVVQLGELVGLIYRATRAPFSGPRNYIHFMQELPRLVCNPEGTQLYLVGGNYRVSARGIEG
jgi:hypothetical protein